MAVRTLLDLTTRRIASASFLPSVPADQLALLPFELVERIWQRLQSIGQLTDALAERLLTRQVDKIAAKNCRGLTDSFFVRTAGAWGVVRELDLTNSRVSDKAVLALADNQAVAAALHTLTLSGCRGVSDDAGKVIASKLLAVQSLNLDSTSITSPTLHELAGAAPRKLRAGKPLVVLSIAQLPRVSGDAVAAVLRAYAATLVRFAIADDKQVSDDVFTNQPAALPHLLHLDASGCTELQDAALSWLSRRAPKLEAIILDRAWRVPPQGWLTLLTARRDTLRVVRAAGCRLPGDLVAAFGQLTTDLVELDISTAVATEQDLMAMLHGCRKLQHLTLGSMKSVTTAVLAQVAECLPALRDFSVYGCGETLVDQGIEHLTRCQHLQRLNLQSCKKVSSDGVRRLLAERRLVSLNLTACVQLLPSTFSQLVLAECLAELQELFLSSITDISDEALVPVASACRQLRRFSVAGTKVSAAGLAPVIRANPHLDLLNISGVAWTAALIDALAFVPDLRKLVARKALFLNDSVLLQMSVRCAFLTVLDISDSHEYTFDGVMAALANLRSLILLDTRRMAFAMNSEHRRKLQQRYPDVMLVAFMSGTERSRLSSF